MSVHTNLQQKLVQYYKATNQADWARLQERSNQETESLHPIASLMYSNEMEVQFFRKIDGSLSANVYSKLNEVIKRVFIATIGEENIIHGGWLYNTQVSKMDKTQKDAFIANISKMRIYKYKNNDIYLY